MRRVRHLGPAHQRQVHDHRQHRQGRLIARHADGVVQLVRRAIDAGLGPHGIDGDAARPLDPVDAPAREPGIAAPGQGDHIPRPEPRLRGRQGKADRVAADMRFGQPAFGHGACLWNGQQQRDLALGHGGRGIARQHRLDGRGRIGIPHRNMRQPQPAGHLGIGRAHRLMRPVLLLGQLRLGQGRRHQPVAHDKAQHAVTLDRVEAIRQHQRLQHRTRRLAALRHIAAHHPRQPRAVKRPDPRGQTNIRHERGQRHGTGAPVQPMPPLPRRAVSPQIDPPRKGRKGTRVPAPDMGARHVHHRPAIDAGRVVRRIAPIAGQRPQIGRLHHIVAPPGRVIGQHRFRAVGVQELVRLVGRLVQRRAADLGEPERF